MAFGEINQVEDIPPIQFPDKDFHLAKQQTGSRIFVYDTILPYHTNPKFDFRMFFIVFISGAASDAVPDVVPDADRARGAAAVGMENTRPDSNRPVHCSTSALVPFVDRWLFAVRVPIPEANLPSSSAAEDGLMVALRNSSAAR